MKLNLFATSPSKQIPSQYKAAENIESGQKGNMALFTEYQQNSISPLTSERSNSVGSKDPKSQTNSAFRLKPHSQTNVQLIVKQVQAKSDQRSPAKQIPDPFQHKLDRNPSFLAQEGREVDVNPMQISVVKQDSQQEEIRALTETTKVKSKTTLPLKTEISIDSDLDDNNSSSKSKQSTRHTDQNPPKVVKLSDKIRSYNPLKNFYLQQQQLFYANLQQQIKLKQQSQNNGSNAVVVRPRPQEIKKQQIVTLPLEASICVPQSSTTELEKKQKAKKPAGPKLIALMSFTMYPIVRQVCKQDFGMKLWEEDNTDDFDLMWADHAIPLERLQRMKAFQRHSQLPGIGCITRKNNLGHNLNAMRAKFLTEYDFFPDTYLFPKDQKRLRQEWDGNTVLIVKPEASCQGKGIYLTREIDEIAEEHCVVQFYIDKPFLMEKMKFDLRLYVLVTGTDPLRIYLSKEGLARLSTKYYDEVDDQNLDDMMMHLTNYSINKNSTKFQPNRAAIVDSVGHKRSLKFTLKYLEKTEKQNSVKLMAEIKDIVVKTMISGQPHLDSVFKSVQIDDFENSMCFQILGFDIMLDHKCKPYLLEVNHSPSFSTDSPLDEKVKGDLIRDTIRMLGLSKQRKAMYKRNIQSQMEHRVKSGKYLRLPAGLKEEWRLEFDAIRNAHEIENLGSYEQIYPCTDESMMQKYDMLIKGAKREFEERNQSKNSIRSRKNTAVNNQRLLSTSTKQGPRSEVKNVDCLATVHNSKPKIQMNQNTGQPPLARPGARKTLPLAMGTDTTMEIERPLMNTKAVSFIEEAGKLGQIIGLSQMVNNLQEKLTQQLVLAPDHFNLRLSSLKLTKKEIIEITPIKQASKYQTTMIKDGSMTPVPSHRQDSIFGQREVPLSHQSSSSKIEVERFNHLQLASFYTPNQNRRKVGVSDYKNYNADINQSANQFKARGATQQVRNRPSFPSGETSLNHLQQHQILNNYEFDVNQEVISKDVRNFTNWKAQESQIQSISKPISKQYYPMMIQATDKQGIDRLIRRKSQKSITGVNKISPIKEESIPLWKDQQATSIGEMLRQAVAEEQPSDIYMNQKRVPTSQIMNKGTNSVPTNKFRKSYRKNTTEVQHASKAESFLPLRQPIQKTFAAPVQSNIGGEFLRPKVLDFQPRSDQADPLRRNNMRKHASNSNYNGASYRLENNQRRQREISNA